MKRLIALILVGAPMLAFAGALDETRYCGEPRRDTKGQPLRRADVLAEFRRLYARPATDQHTGQCKGWAIDHVIPLAVGGCDAVRNLQWLPTKLKSCAGSCKDRWERDVYLRKVAPWKALT